MCCGRTYKPKELEIVFPFYTYHKMGIYGLFQLVILLCGVAIFFKIVKLPANIIIAIVCAVISLLPRPFFINISRAGSSYVVFEEMEQNVCVIYGRYFNLYWSRVQVCKYPQFRGIAVRKNKPKVLLLTRGTESYRMPTGDKYKTDFLDAISKWWVTNGNDYEFEVFFGVTCRPFEQGLEAEGGVEVKVDFDYYKMQREHRKAGIAEHANELEEYGVADAGFKEEVPVDHQLDGGAAKHNQELSMSDGGHPDSPKFDRANGGGFVV